MSSPGLRAAHLSPARTMGPPFRQWHGTTPEATSTDLAMMDQAVAMVKEPVRAVRRWRRPRDPVRGR